MNAIFAAIWQDIYGADHEADNPVWKFLYDKITLHIEEA